MTAIGRVGAAAPAAPTVAALQRRVIVVLSLAQVLGSMGVATGSVVGALVIVELSGGAGLAGLATSLIVFGSAALAVPTAIASGRWGRRRGLVCGLGSGALGAGLVVAAVQFESVGLALVGLFLFGGATTAGMQARFAAADLATPESRARQMSVVLWMTTVGSVSGPVLMTVAESTAKRFGLPTYTGAFSLSVAAFVLAGGVLLAFLRPDPLLVARGAGRGNAPTGPALSGLSALFVEPRRMLGVVTLSAGHLIMVSVMAMTPVHVAGAHVGHGGSPEASLPAVGVIISVHVAAMYALAPVFGWAVDRFGPRPVIVVGVATLTAACLLAASAGNDLALLGVALFLLGLGWSGAMVAGSALIVDATPTEHRTSVQGVADLVMNVVGGVIAMVGGLVVSGVGYAALALLVVPAVVPVLVLVWMSRLRPGGGR